MSNRLRLLKEMLIKNIKNSSQVFIIGHNTPDYDAIGAALGMVTIAQELNKDAYIIVNDSQQSLDPGVAKVIEESKEDYTFIDLEEYKSLADLDSLLIAVDVNKKYLTPLQDDLDKVGNIIIVDHHQETEQTMEATYKYIDYHASSTCEIVAQLLNSLQIKYSKNMANYLYAGIVLDTQNFRKNTTATTHDTAEKLYAKGARFEVVSKWRVANFEEDQKLNDLIFGSHIIREIGENETTEIKINNNSIQVYTNILGAPKASFVINRMKPHEIYRQDMLAKAADKILSNYAEIAFVFGYVKEDVVGISARSKCDVDVGRLLGKLEKIDPSVFPQLQIILPPVCTGGGNKQNAGGSVTTSDIFSVEEFFMNAMKEMAPEEETIVSQQENEEPIVLVKKQAKVKVLKK
ncbi:MAG: DHH family phosphoesterase [bacterium]|nr:DHH family phosphoesterase [Mycoplasmatota bacterium]MDD6756983.1 DHH family phosphoesterase [bacterium]